jgi:CRP-like cAMP-binding protein
MKEVIDEVIRRRLVEKINIRNLYIGEDAEAQYRLFMTHQPDIAARVPQKDIASFLGITPQSLSRIRKNLSR